VAGGELGLALHRVDADADRLRPDRAEIRGDVAEVAGLHRAARGHRRRVEEQYDRPVGQQVGQPPGRALLVLEFEVRHHVADIHPRHLPGNDPTRTQDRHNC
jgi:hypothetical protein